MTRRGVRTGSTSAGDDEGALRCRGRREERWKSERVYWRAAPGSRPAGRARRSRIRRRNSSRSITSASTKSHWSPCTGRPRLPSGSQRRRVLWSRRGGSRSSSLGRSSGIRQRNVIRAASRTGTFVTVGSKSANLANRWAACCSVQVSFAAGGFVARALDAITPGPPHSLSLIRPLCVPQGVLSHGCPAFVALIPADPFSPAQPRNRSNQFWKDKVGWGRKSLS